MKPQKKKACHGNDRLQKEGDMLLDSARIIASCSDPVKLIEAKIRYHRLAESLYRKNLGLK